MTTEEPESFTVDFNRAQLRKVLRIAVPMTLIGGAIAVFLTLNVPRGFMMWILLLCGYLMVPLGLILTYWIVSKLASKGPAFEADREGISIYFAYQPKMRFAWKEILPPYLSEPSGSNPDSIHFCVVPEKEAYAREAKPLQAFGGRFSTNGAPISIGLSLLDATWAEIEEGLSDYIMTRSRPPTDQEVEEDIYYEDIKRQVRDNLEKRQTLDGKLNTLADFREHFRTNPVGCWTPKNQGFTQSPVDQDIVFYPDHSGYYTDTPFHVPIPFEWREKGDYQVDIRHTDEGVQMWFTIEYEFHDGKPPTAEFWVEGESEESPDDWDGFPFTMDSYVFAGLPQHSGVAEAMTMD